MRSALPNNPRPLVSDYYCCRLEFMVWGREMPITDWFSSACGIATVSSRWSRISSRYQNCRHVFFFFGLLQSAFVNSFGFKYQSLVYAQLDGRRICRILLFILVTKTWRGKKLFLSASARAAPNQLAITLNHTVSISPSKSPFVSFTCSESATQLAVEAAKACASHQS